MRWIFGNFAKDFAWIFMPGLLALVATFLIGKSDPQTWPVLVYVFIGTALLDAGHVYTTLWRTYFHGPERRRRRLYVWAPVLLFALFFIWAWARLPYLGSFVVYATLFHNVRQFFGIAKWYQKENRAFSPSSDRFLYALCGLPFLAAHFRTDVFWNSYYTPADLFLYPSAGLFAAVLALYFAVVAAWIVFEFRRRALGEWNRVAAVALPALLYAISFLYGQTIVEILLPLVIAHGAAYIGLMALAMDRAQRERYRFAGALFLLVLTAAAFGSAEWFIEDATEGLSNFSVAGLTALTLTPLFCHYYFDAFLWRGDHPEAAKVFSPSSV